MGEGAGGLEGIEGKEVKERVIGLISGSGDLPLLAAESARLRGFNVVIIALVQESVERLAGFSEKIYHYQPGQVKRIIQCLKKEKVRQVVLVGKIEKKLLLKGLKLDLKALNLLRRLPDYQDDTILNAVTETLEKEGFSVVSQASFLQNLCQPQGILTHRSPRQEEWNDITYGFSMAKKIAALGIGQTIVVKNRAVIAIEALEGTDETIKRGGDLGGPGSVVVKVCRPYQDSRLDLPTVGLLTITTLIEAKASALAFEASKTLMVNPEESLALANQAGLAIVAIDETLLAQYV